MDNAERMTEVLEEELRKIKEGTSDGFAMLRFKSYKQVSGRPDKARVSTEMAMFNPRRSNLIHIAASAIAQVLKGVLQDGDQPTSRRFDKDGNDISAEVEPASEHRNRAAKGWTN